MSQEAYGLSGALEAALAEVEDGRIMSAKLVGSQMLEHAREVCIYIKVIRFDADKLRRDPMSGGLLAEL